MTHTPHLYVNELCITGGNIIIKDIKKVHYLKDVLRLGKEEKITIFDKEANQYLCKIKEISNQKVVLDIIRKIPTDIILPRIKIAFGLIKKTASLDDLVNKLTQLGVYKIIPMITRRVVVKWDEDKKLKHILRWQRIAVSASQQSRRGFIPIIEEIKNIKDVLKQEEAELKLIFTLYGRRVSLRSIFSKEKIPQDILVLVGPEGDFSLEELAEAKEQGFIPVSLGDLVLRTETAIISAVSFIRLYAQN